MKGGEKVMARYSYIRASGVRKFAKEKGRRCRADFLSTLDRTIFKMVEEACEVSRGEKTLKADDLI